MRREKKRIIFATTASWVVKESKIITIESQKEHYCQGKLMTTIFFLSHFFFFKWNYGLFLCNRLKELQIWMIIFIFLFELAFCEIICSLVVWSSFVFVWIIFVVNLVFFFFLVVYGVRDYVWETIIIFEKMLHLQHFKTNLI